ncbi:FGGY family carbohydrate kinase [Nocardioides sp. GY 10127]|uniref:FGGY family carbohydrate kinase n=1 Tax=Nocardioides sp. GY 10127 TaxID=2569762 RepID=UPI001457FBDA|nr:FGGY family carbohydrate kinase [Nocardioides sp. GY 10127]
MSVTTGRDVVLAIDQGTGSTKAVAVDAAGAVVARCGVPVGKSHPAPGHVEQDPGEILASVREAVAGALAALPGGGARVAALALSTQRESALVWDTATGEPQGPMLSWQDRRTAGTARSLLDAGHGPLVEKTSGLPVDPMFSALKLGWLLDRVDPDRSRSGAGLLTVGTLDSWLVARLTGERRIEVGNASRTQLLDLDAADWDAGLAALFCVPLAALPPVVASDAPTGPVRDLAGLEGVPIAAVLGDSHAALFGHGVRGPGAVKATFGTGSSVMGLEVLGTGPVEGLVRTIAWQVGGAAPATAFEGNVLATGATLVWLADLLGTTVGELADLGHGARPDHGLSLVPAFAGLGAPWWDEAAEGLLTGLTLGAGRAEVARAGLESVVLQVEDVLAAADGAGARVEAVLVDGGPTGSDALVQLQADVSRRTLRRSAAPELSALGAARLAGTVVGLWDDAAAPLDVHDPRVFDPAPLAAGEDDPFAATRARWRTAVAKARSHPQT